MSNGGGYGAPLGLDTTLRELLRGYMPSDGGPCIIGNEISMSIPLPASMEWSSFTSAEITLAAAEADPTTVYTIPNDERFWLEFVMTNRRSGDNLFNAIEIEWPAGYWRGETAVQQLLIVTAAGNVFWPDPAAVQAGLAIPLAHVPLLLEPGTIIRCDPTAAGVSATVVRVLLVGRTSKVVRHLAPWS